jgi:hypothetical protein
LCHLLLRFHQKVLTGEKVIRCHHICRVRIHAWNIQSAWLVLCMMALKRFKKLYCCEHYFKWVIFVASLDLFMKLEYAVCLVGLWWWYCTTALYKLLVIVIFVAFHSTLLGIIDLRTGVQHSRPHLPGCVMRPVTTFVNFLYTVRTTK